MIKLKVKLILRKEREGEGILHNRLIRNSVEIPAHLQRNNSFHLILGKISSPHRKPFFCILMDPVKRNHTTFVCEKTESLSPQLSRVEQIKHLDLIYTIKLFLSYCREQMASLLIVFSVFKNCEKCQECADVIEDKDSGS